MTPLTPKLRLSRSWKESTLSLWIVFHLIIIVFTVPVMVTVVVVIFVSALVGIVLVLVGFYVI